MTSSRIARKIAVTAALTAVLWSGAVGAASAEDTSESDVTVSVPAATPAPPPPPGNPPQNNNPPAENNGGGGGGTNTGTSVPTNRGGGGGGGTGTTAPAGEAGPATEPVIADAPSTTGVKVTTDKEHYVLGENVSVRMEGLAAGEQVQVVLYSEPRLIANVPAGADGVVAHTFALPEDLPVGTHTVQLTGWQSTTVGTAEIFVTAMDATAAADSAQGVPFWVWWVAGGLGAVLLVAGGVWVIRAMRAPEAVPAEAVA